MVSKLLRRGEWVYWGFCIVGRGSLNKKYVSSKRLSDKQAGIRLSKDAIKRESIFRLVFIKV